ncbi:MAG: AI-2E family transporter [Gemmataceae bacterium]|nr:AI-2E family transporter [Gemmataceae bacterium]
MIPFPTNTATRVGINILILLGSVVALRLGQTVFIPIVIALLLAAVLGPAAEWLHAKLKIRWTLSCLTVIVGLLLLNLFIFMVFGVAFARMAQQFPSTDKEIIKYFNDFRGKLEQIWPWPLDEELFPLDPKRVEDIRAYEVLTKAAPQMLKWTVDYVGNGLWQWILILFILLFLLLEGRMLTRRVIAIFGPSEEVRAKAGAVLLDMAQQVRTYLVWRTIINFGLAVVIGAVYQFAGLRQAWTWAILLAILNYVPYLGPLLAGVPPLLDAFIFADPVTTLVVAILYGVIIIVEGYLIVPLIMGRSMEMNATTVMIACLFWDLVWGIVGLFLAMPIMAGVKAVCYHVPGWRPWANLMGTEHEDERPTPEQQDLSIEQVIVQEPAKPVPPNGELEPKPQTEKTSA